MKKFFKTTILVALFATTTVAGIKKDAPIDINASLNKYASANLTGAYSNARIVIDNDESFRQKIEMIRKATKSIDMMYYIYATDQSASLFTKEIVAAAKRGVRVNLLLDYFMNYKNLDLFNWMRAQSPLIDIRLYGRPTEAIIKDAIYMTTPCPKAMAENKCAEPTGIENAYAVMTPQERAQILDQRHCAKDFDVACTNEKLATVDAIIKKAKADHETMLSFAPTQMIPTKDPKIQFPISAGLLLSGMYAKNPKFMGAVMALTQAIDKEAQIDWAQGFSADDRAKLKKFFKLYWGYKTGDNMGIKLYFEAKNDVDVIEPVFTRLDRYVPTQNAGPLPEDKVRRNQDWDYITDYLHHKIILVDGKAAMVGGRNIENSYNMTVNDAKYVFMDTELALDTKGSGMKDAYTKMFDFYPLVARLDEVNKLMPIDGLVNFYAGAKSCEQSITTAKIQIAAQNKLTPVPVHNIKGQIIKFQYKDQANHILTPEEEAAINLNVGDEEGVACMLEYLTKNFKTSEQRFPDIKANIDKQTEKYNAEVRDYGPAPDVALADSAVVNPPLKGNYANAKETHNLVDIALKQTAGMDSSFTITNGVFPVSSGLAAGYLENLPFSKFWLDKKTGKVSKATYEKRNFGAEYAREQYSGKNIHKLWVDELLSICKKPGPQEVILHSAYWFPSSNLLMALGKMGRIFKDSNDIDEQGGWRNLDCHNVTVKIITNSVKSTDLAPVNMYASFAMYSFYQALEKRIQADQKAVDKEKNAKRKADKIAEMNKRAKIEYYQYSNAPTQVELNGEKFDQVFSLHTKLSLIGDDVIVGSANGDIRSFAMDSNNAFIIRGDANFASQYRKFINTLIKTYKIVRVDTELKNPMTGQTEFVGFRNLDPRTLRAETFEAMKENRFFAAYKANRIAKMFAAAGIDLNTVIPTPAILQEKGLSIAGLMIAASSGIDLPNELKSVLKMVPGFDVENPTLNVLYASTSSTVAQQIQGRVKNLDAKFDGYINILLNYLENVRKRVAVMLLQINEPIVSENQPLPPTSSEFRTIVDENTAEPKQMNDMQFRKFIEKAKQDYDRLYKAI